MVRNFKQITESSNNCLKCQGFGIIEGIRCNKCEGTGTCIDQINFQLTSKNEETYNKFLIKLSDIL